MMRKEEMESFVREGHRPHPHFALGAGLSRVLTGTWGLCEGQNVWAWGNLSYCLCALTMLQASISVCDSWILVPLTTVNHLSPERGLLSGSLRHREIPSCYYGQPGRAKVCTTWPPAPTWDHAPGWPALGVWWGLSGRPREDVWV